MNLGSSLPVFGQALGLAAAAGLNLYLATFAAGLAIHFHWIQLQEPFSSLAVLDNGWIIGISGLLFALEFFADKIPGVDSLWDLIHSVIRPLGGAALAMQSLGALSPEMAVLGALLGGATAATLHAAKSGTRILANTSPEPFSNSVLSLTEDGAVLGMLWLLFFHPLLSLLVVACFLLLLAFLLPKLLRKIGGLWRTTTGCFGSAANGKKGGRNC